MSENLKPQQKIKTTIIPLHLSINSNLGILKFLSEQSGFKIQNPEIELKKIQQDVTYKNAVGKQQQQEDDEQQLIKKKVVNINRIIIKSKHWNKKYYKADIPANKYAGLHGRNRDRIHFVLQFGNDNKGQLTMIDDVYDCQLEVASNNQQKMMTFDEKIKMQNVKFDARRRQERVEIVTEKKDNKRKDK